MTGRWLSDFLRLALGLGLAIAAMQVPALTHAYDSALVQVAEEARRDIAQRKEVARGYYGLDDTSDSGVVAALRTREPSNAQGLESSLARERALRAAHERIAAAPGLLQPVHAVLDAMDDPLGNKWAILRTAVGLHVPQVLLGTAPAVYGLVGLLIGLFLANLLITLLSLMFRGRPARAA